MPIVRTTRSVLECGSAVPLLEWADGIESGRALAHSKTWRTIVRFRQMITPMTDTELKTRASLIERLRDRDDRDSWREFFNRYWKLVYGLAIKSGLTEGEAEEVVQE